MEEMQKLNRLIFWRETKLLFSFGTDCIFANYYRVRDRFLTKSGELRALSASYYHFSSVIDPSTVLILPKLPRKSLMRLLKLGPSSGEFCRIAFPAGSFNFTAAIHYATLKCTCRFGAYRSTIVPR